MEVTPTAKYTILNYTFEIQGKTRVSPCLLWTHWNLDSSQDSTYLLGSICHILRYKSWWQIRSLITISFQTLGPRVLTSQSLPCPKYKLKQMAIGQKSPWGELSLCSFAVVLHGHFTSGTQNIAVNGFHVWNGFKLVNLGDHYLQLEWLTAASWSFILASFELVLYNCLQQVPVTVPPTQLIIW